MAHPAVLFGRELWGRVVIRLVGLVVLLAAAPAAALDLHVMVNGVRSGDGDVRVALYRNADGFATAEGRYREVVVSARRGSVEVVFTDLPPGTYGLASFHDENANGAFDSDFFGFPEEGFAFGNDAPVDFGPPDFADAAVTVDGDAAHKTTIMLRYW